MSWQGLSTEDFIRFNSREDLPIQNSQGQLIVIGCNYHTAWQTEKSMRFVLSKVKDGKARLLTRQTSKDFWCDINDLIFIRTHHNFNKAQRYRPTINVKQN